MRRKNRAERRSRSCREVREEVNILTACVRWKSHREAATLKRGKSEGRKREKVSQLIRKTKRTE